MNRLSTVSLSLAISLLTTTISLPANADSSRIKWDANGHFYQLFEGSPVTWSDAKTTCEGMSAHLVSITSEQEQGFVYSQLLTGRSDYNWYHIGATSDDTYTWHWVSNENFSAYSLWETAHGFPYHEDGRNYAGILVNRNIAYSNYSGYYGQWINTYADWKATGYICEWSTNTFIDTTLVPDLNNNGIDEVAVLYVDYQTGQHTVQIKDPATDKLLKTLTFSTSFVPPSGFVVLSDSNNNDIPEIGVLSTRLGNPSVAIKDINTGALVRSVNFLTSAYRPKSIGRGNDVDGNGFEEIVVLGISKNTGAAKAEIRDSKTGKPSNNTNF